VRDGRENNSEYNTLDKKQISRDLKKKGDFVLQPAREESGQTEVQLIPAEEGASGGEVGGGKKDDGWENDSEVDSLLT